MSPFLSSPLLSSPSHHVATLSRSEASVEDQEPGVKAHEGTRCGDLGSEVGDRTLLHGGAKRGNCVSIVNAVCGVMFKLMLMFAIQELELSVAINGRREEKRSGAECSYSLDQCIFLADTGDVLDSPIPLHV